MYALNLDPKDNRILSATEDRYGAEGQPRVDRLLDDDISDYKYIDGEFVYDPLPKPRNQSRNLNRVAAITSHMTNWRRLLRKE